MRAMTARLASRGLDDTVSDRPRAIDGLDVTEVKDGLVVYDPGRNRVHYLNVSAAVIFTLCNGGRDRQSIVEAATKVFGADVISPRDVEACIARLEDERVLRSAE